MKQMWGPIYVTYVLNLCFRTNNPDSFIYAADVNGTLQAQEETSQEKSSLPNSLETFVVTHSLHQLEGKFMDSSQRLSR